jgi:NTP pyrophosphatase (non-canonical NTP hydrolase)
MDANKFQNFTLTTAQYPGAGKRGIEAIIYLALGLSGEAGEVAGKVKKVIRDSNGKLTEEAKIKIKDEVSDVCWYIARLLDELECTFEDALQYNADKLLDRLNRGVIKGDGDNR